LKNFDRKSLPADAQALASGFAFSSTFRAEVFSEAVADDFEDGRVIHESMERFCPGSTADDNDIFRRIER
jgi:hypothetical protein